MYSTYPHSLKRYNLGSLASGQQYSSQAYALTPASESMISQLVTGLMSGTVDPRGNYDGNPSIMVAQVGSSLMAYSTLYDGGVSQMTNVTVVTPSTHPTLPWPQMIQSGIELLGVATMSPQEVTTTGGCPPPDNCQEKWVDKTLYVSAYPSADAIPIPVAFKKVICDIESDTPPEIDCDDLLEALTQSVDQGAVGNMAMAGLANPYALPDPQGSTDSVPANLPPDWCNDCQEKLVKATAYVTERPTTGSKPFDVKMKVIVCDATGEPQIDCATAIEAIKTGMKQRRWKALSGLANRYGLSEATATGTDEAFIDEEASLVGEGSAAAVRAGFSPLLWILLAAVGVGFYAMNK